ncbi:hypothetical protein [Kribbella sp. NPDC023855]|uniref:hypothetical protein n=1 Tax=Kribbella sp. NPDC023855 TaxID=3154698 RepID=UPI0033C7F431
MKTGRVMVAIGSALVGLAALLVAAPSAVAGPGTAQWPDPDPALSVTSVTLGRSAVLVSGLNRVVVGVTVTAGYNSETETPLNVILARTGGVGPLNSMIGDLRRTGGTLKNGTWTGTVEVPSTANGTFKVTGVLPGYLDPRGSIYESTPFDGPSIAVTGVHLPKLAVQVIPKIVPFGSAYQVKAVIYDSATGKPYGVRLPLRVVSDEACHDYGTATRLTDTAGVLYTSFPAAAADTINCVRVRSRVLDTISRYFNPLRPGIVAAAPSKTSVPVSTVVPVNGSVAGAPQVCPVLLQRLYGRTVWRLVSKSTVRQSGRFTVLAQPPNLGSNTYRVYFPTCGRFQAGYSRTFAILGT